MNILADTKFSFHSVGQGLFYSGKINFKSNGMINKQFLFVYDCGAEKKSKIDYEVTRFKNSVYKNSQVIDMLVLSHFHADHVNGLDKLLNYFDVKKVIIPYFNPIERLILSLQNINQEEWYYSFLSKPFHFFIDRGVEEIIVINKGKGSDQNVLNENHLIPYLDSFKDLDLLIKLENENEQVKDAIYKNENIDESKKDKTIKIYTHIGHITILNLWLFKFFNYEISIKALNTFKNYVENINKDIKKNIMRKALRDKIKECYNEVKNSSDLKNFNNTSLVMMHTPINHKEVRGFKVLNNRCSVFFPFYCFCDYDFDSLEDFFHCLRHCCHPRFHHKVIDKCHFDKCFAQSLTGDIDLNFNYRQFSTHFNFFKNKLFINQIPHHGSNKNWNNNFLGDFIPFFNIASAGETNQYGHPSIDVFEKIIENCSLPFQVDENHWFTVKAKFSW